MSSIRPISLLLGTQVVALALPEGFVIREFAGPPQVEYPTGISAAANGDVYVSVDKNGSLGHEKDYGKIVIARDSDGDGRADWFSDYVPSVDSPRGGHFVGGDFYLIHPPYLTRFRDTNGDGVADERKLLVEGFGWGIEHPRGADHTTNGVRMGIDGWLYVGVGDFGMPDAKGADGTRYTLRGGGVVRVRPDGSEMEPYALMTRNHFAPAISPYLDLFVRDNTNDGKGWNTRFHHFTSMGDHGYPRLYQNFNGEAVQPLADYGGGSGTGAAYIHEPGFPEGFGDTVYTCDWTTGHVHYHPLKPFEATFIASQETFLKLPRAIDIDVDGFSRIYLADWRNGGYRYGGPKVKVGMIQQVVHPAGKAASYTEVTRVADAELSGLLASRSGVQRIEAQREILARGRKPVFANGVMALAKDAKAPLYARVAAIFTFKQLYGKDSTQHLAELAGEAPVREFVLRAMTDRLTELDGVPPAPYLAGLQDPNPRVRLQAAIGLGRLKAAAAAPALIAAAAEWEKLPASTDGGHPRLPHTAVKALARIGNVQACLDALKTPDQRGIALRALQEIHGSEAVDGLVRIADETREDALREAVLGALARLYHVERPWDLKAWWNTRPDDRGPYFEPVEWQGTPQVRDAIERNFGKLPENLRPAMIEHLSKNRIKVAALKLTELDPVLAAIGASALDASQLRVLLDAARDDKRPWDQRLDCFRALANATPNQIMPSRLAVLAHWSTRDDAPAAVTEAITDFINDTQRGAEVPALRELAARQSDAVSRIAWKALLTIRQSPLSSEDAKRQVAAAIDGNPRELGFFQAIADLGLSGFDKQIEVGIHSDNEQLIAVARAAREAGKRKAATGRKVAEATNPEVLEFAMNHQGDVGVGKRLFTAQGCIACHSVDPAAVQKGPYLGAAGAKFTRDYLIESITEPNKVVAQGFRSSIFQMNDGSAHLGFVTGEEDGVVELRDITGQAREIRRSEVKSQQELPNSMMPPGLGANLTLEEFTSLVEYLVSLRAVGG
jgi:putative heme-binding domain-containing protein